MLRPDSESTWERRYDAGEPGAAVWEHRIDRGEVLSSVKRRDGTLLVVGAAARAGVYEYRRADGTLRRELVREDTLKRSAAGLGRAPVTLHHPDPKKHPKGVTPDNVGELGVGDTDGEVEWVADGGFVRVKLAVRRREALDAIASGTQELSPGYGVLLGPGGDDPVYGRYDAEQLERDYNHLAIVDAARGGADVRLYLDDVTAICTETITGASNTTSSGSPAGSATPTATGGPLKLSPLVAQLVAQFGLGAQRFDSDEQAQSAILAEQQRRDAAAKEAEKQRTDSADKAEREHKAALEKLQGERDGEKRRADTAEAEVVKLKTEATQRADAEQRKGLEKLAKHFRVDAAAHPDTKALKRAIAKAYNGGKLREDASDDYVAGMLEGAQRELDRGRRDRDDDDLEDPDDDRGRDDADDRGSPGRRAGRAAWRAGQRDDEDDLDDDDRDERGARDDRDDPPRRERGERPRGARGRKRPLTPAQASLARYDAARLELERDGGEQ